MISWIRINSYGKFYKSTCGRFAIMYMKFKPTNKRWALFDRNDKGAGRWFMEGYYSLSLAKRAAEEKANTPPTLYVVMLNNQPKLVCASMEEAQDAKKDLEDEYIQIHQNGKGDDILRHWRIQPVPGYKDIFR